MRANPKLDIETAITELAVGEALVSFLDPKGRPSVTERVFVIPPGSQIGPITPEQRKALIAGSLVAGVYEKAVDKESAYEKLKGRAAASADRAQEMQAEAENATKAPRPLPGRQPAPPQDDGGMLGGLKDLMKSVEVEASLPDTEVFDRVLNANTPREAAGPLAH